MKVTVVFAVVLVLLLDGCTCRHDEKGKVDLCKRLLGKAEHLHELLKKHMHQNIQQLDKTLFRLGILPNEVRVKKVVPEEPSAWNNLLDLMTLCPVTNSELNDVTKLVEDSLTELDAKVAAVGEKVYQFRQQMDRRQENLEHNSLSEEESAEGDDILEARSKKLPDQTEVEFPVAVDQDEPLNATLSVLPKSSDISKEEPSLPQSPTDDKPPVSASPLSTAVPDDVEDPNKSADKSVVVLPQQRSELLNENPEADLHSASDDTPPLGSDDALPSGSDDTLPLANDDVPSSGSDGTLHSANNDTLTASESEDSLIDSESKDDNLHSRSDNTLPLANDDIPSSGSDGTLHSANNDTLSASESEDSLLDSESKDDNLRSGSDNTLPLANDDALPSGSDGTVHSASNDTLSASESEDSLLDSESKDDNPVPKLP